MPGLRRRYGPSSSYPLAAEVLETRALLSGAAAVHAAVHHAATGHATPITPQAAQVPGTAAISLSPSIFGSVPGHFTTLKPGQKVGDKVTIKFQGAVSAPASETFKVSFTGIITDVAGPAGSQIFTVAPKGGSFLLTITPPPGTGHTEKYAGKSDLTPFTITESGGSVAEVEGTFSLSPKNPPLANSGTGTIDIAT